MYPIEQRIASKNGWHTPQEAQAYYGRYSREGITIHWWGDGSGASNHDNIVNYFLNQAAAGNKSVNYVVSDNKITLVVSPDNVAWCSHSGNPTTISIEHQPTLGAEGYKRSGWLVWRLEQRYGRRLNLYPHSKWFATQCPGSIDINRIRAEADKWASGGYNPPVVVTPPADTAQNVSISYSVLPTPIDYIVNKNTNLWNFNSATWGGIKAVKPLAKGEPYKVFAIADNHTLKAKYAVTEYSYSRKLTNGVNIVDLDLKPSQPIPTPPEVPTPPVQPPVVPPVTEPDRNAIIAFLTTLRDLITEFLGRFKK